MEAVLLCGVQGAGKTTFYAERFLHTHVRISRDLLRTPAREARFLGACLETRQPFVVDKINATPEDRAPYVQAALGAGFRAVAYWLDVAAREAVARNERREGSARVPVEAILGTRKRFVVPTPLEGFDAVWRVESGPSGWVVSELSAPAAPAPAAGAPASRR